MAKINETLRQLRLDRDLTQEQVAEQVGLTRQAVSAYESGRTQPGLDILQRMADVYHVELTDIIYGGNRTVRLRNALKITAIAMACVILAAQFVEALLLWTANHFFSLEEGPMSAAEMLILETRQKLLLFQSGIGTFYLALFPLCCVALLVLSLCLNRPLAVKTKLLSVLGFALASAVVVLPWALADQVYGMMNYIYLPIICLSRLLLTLLLSLAIDFFRVRKRRRTDAIPKGETE